MKRRIRILLLCTAAIPILLLSDSKEYAAAYMTDSDYAENIISVGSAQISIQEDFQPEEPEAGSLIKKEVKVKNTGLSSCYVRAMVLYSDNRAENYFTLDFQADDWVLGTDGYWYYLPQVEPGGETTLLLKNISVSGSYEADFYMPFEIYVYAECMQAAGAADCYDAWK